MNKLSAYINRTWVTDLLLFLLTFCIYFYYFPHVFLNLNSILSSIEGDSLKNYYTFVYHIKNDPGFLNFAGMNFPFGEHVIYTDSHPGLTLILQYLPFTHDYLIGIMHFLIFLSYMVAPLITNRLFTRLGVHALSAFFISIGITLLAPQILRIYAGHFSMAYAIVIPLSALLTLNYFRTATNKAVFNLFIYNLLMFFIHPYLAFGLCLFNLLSMAIFELQGLKKQLIVKKGIAIFTAGLLPMLLFKLFLLVTDQHLNRPTLPYGLNTSVCTFGSLLVPSYGPFSKFLEATFHTVGGEFEGYCYLGIALITITIVFALLLPFLYKKMQFSKEALVLLAASFILLLFSFGVHLKLANIDSEALNQFRALGRFSWFFYYMLPLFVFTTLYHAFKRSWSAPTAYRAFGLVAFVFFVFNLVEAGSFFRLYEKGYWHDRNFFNEKLLNADEQQVIAKLRADKPQAIIPLPTYNIGSEIYDRMVGDNLAHPLIPSFIYSYHTGLPIASAMLSRNPITETEDVIQLLNSYKKDKTAAAFLNGKPFLIIKTKAPLMPDEDRLLQKTSMFRLSDSLQFGYLPQAALLAPITDKKIITISKAVPQLDSNSIVYIDKLDKTPFLLSNSKNYENMFRLDSNTISSGKYIVSLHYHYKNNSWKDMLCHFLLVKSNGSYSEWKDFVSMRLQSGFYKGYGVFEYTVDLERGSNYDFIMKNDSNIYYRVSDFMLRPKGTTVKVAQPGKAAVYNNFPAE